MIDQTLEIIHWLEGRACVLCGNHHSEVHHIVEKSKVKGRARKVAESKPELLAKLCSQHHRGFEGVHSLRSARQRLFEHKVRVYGLDGMQEALEMVNQHLKIKLTWKGLGYKMNDGNATSVANLPRTTKMTIIVP